MKKILFLGVIVLILIGTAVSSIFLIRIDGATLYERMHAVQVLKGLVLTKSAQGEAGLYSFGFLGPKEKIVENVPGSIIGYAHTNDSDAAIVRMESGAEEVFYMISGEQKALTATGTPKASLALSPEGDFLAYSAASSPEEKSLLSAWTLHLYNLHTGTDVELGPGYGSQFVERDGQEFLVYTTQEAITFVATDDLSGFSTPFQVQDDTAFAVSLSPDGKYLASRDTARRAWNLYSVKTFAKGLPLSLSPVEVDISGLDTVHLTDTSVIGIEPNWSLTEESRDLVGGTVREASFQDMKELKPLYKFSSPSAFMFTN